MFLLGKRQVVIQKPEKELEEQTNLMDYALENKNNKGFSFFLYSKSYHYIKKNIIMHICIKEADLLFVLGKNYHCKTLYFFFPYVI